MRRLLFYFLSLGIREVTKAVKEMVTLSCEYNVSMDELARVRVYWQKNSDMVLSIISGNMRVWPDYENRTILDIANRLSLVILALRLSDNGEYTCVVQKMERESFVVRQRLGVRLFVKADFPTPSIIDLGNPSPTIRSILCSTSEGFPEPHLSWWENGEELSAVNTVVSKDPKTELFTVSSELRFNTTSNHSFECLVKFRGLTVSQIFNWQKHRPGDHALSPRAQERKEKATYFPVCKRFLFLCETSRDIFRQPRPPCTFSRKKLSTSAAVQKHLEECGGHRSSSAALPRIPQRTEELANRCSYTTPDF
ncbi:T-lymphocyte activation antigen CD80 [Ctenodactylus gundi]